MQQAADPARKHAAEGDIARGRLDQKQLYRCRLSPDELLAQLRLKNVRDLSEVDWAILEQSGQLSVFLKNGEPEEKNESAKHGAQEESPGLSLPLIVNGTWHKSNLTRLSVTKKAVRKTLGGRRITDVLLYTSDGKKKETVVFRDKEL